MAESERLVRPSGFEPETCGLRVRCSAVELEARNDISNSSDSAGIFCLSLQGFGLKELIETKLSTLATIARLLIATEGSRDVEGSSVDIDLPRADLSCHVFCVSRVS